jgi:hypothetical protein
MRRLLVVSLIATVAGLIPAIAWAGNQEKEIANQIRDRLKSSGQLIDYKVSIKYLNGTAWLQGRVHDADQKRRAEQLVLEVPGVKSVVADDLKIGGRELNGTASSSAAGLMGRPSVANPLRGSDSTSNRASQVSASYSTSRPVMATNMEQPMPTPAPLPANNAAPMANGGPEATGIPGGPLPMAAPGAAYAGPAPVRYDQPCMPNYAWPSYAAYPNYAGVTYPRQYSATAWPYIGPFYPYPQVPLGWRKVSLQWDDGWWFLDFKDRPSACWWR